MENLPHYLSIIVILILTGCGLPVPEEFPIIAAGVASSGANPDLNPWIALGSCLIGALIGDSMLYAIGYYFGHNLVKAHPRLARLLHAEREAKMEEQINKHGLKVLFLARFMVGIRAPVYLSIGILRTSYKKFLLFDAFCATAVVSFFFGLSYLFGDNVKNWIRDSEKVFTAIVVGVILIVVLIFLVRRRRRGAASGDTEVPAESKAPDQNAMPGDSAANSEKINGTELPKQDVASLPANNGLAGATHSTPPAGEKATAQHAREE